MLPWARAGRSRQSTTATARGLALETTTPQRLGTAEADTLQENSEAHARSGPSAAKYYNEGLSYLELERSLGFVLLGFRVPGPRVNKH